MIAPADLTTGADVIAAVTAAAARQNIPLMRFIAPLSASPSRWIRDVSNAHHPREVTLARVRALLEGRAIPGRQKYQPSGQYVGRRINPDYARPGTPKVAFSPVDRDPCFKCGVRGDIGCSHRSPR
ncbi:hypothetical protein [Sphingobium sp. AP50]|uniref:hypothetical protein n=1 Tax=Sphingobium sp. AP50 TaxID=1884369 RepID=UPI001C42EC90|nr:hypothetical protein [Sphingobium sp. AP50]